MKLEGTYTVRARRERVWALLTEPENLARCLPGCEKLVASGENAYEMTMKVGVAAVKGTYAGKISLSEMTPTSHLRISVSGRGTPGFLDGQGSIHLEEAGDQTLLRYSGEVQVGGVVASVGQRMLEGAARLILNQFFQNLSRQLTASPG